MPSGNSNGRRRAERFTEPHGYGHAGQHRNRARTSNANRSAIVHGANSYRHHDTLADAAICDVGRSRNGNTHPGATLRHFHSGIYAVSHFGTGLRNSHRSVDGNAHSGTPFADRKPISVADVGIGRHLWQRSSGRGRELRSMCGRLRDRRLYRRHADPNLPHRPRGRD
jgi:hypothetical protein